MKKLLVLIAAFAGGLFAQGQVDYGYEFWTSFYTPLAPSALSPVGFTNYYVPQDVWAPDLQSDAYCVQVPFPGAHIFFAFQLTSGCPQGGYVSEQGVNSDPNMVQDGAVIDIQLFVQAQFQWEYDCQSFYYEPTVYYDDFLGCY